MLAASAKQNRIIDLCCEAASRRTKSILIDVNKQIAAEHFSTTTQITNGLQMRFSNWHT